MAALRTIVKQDRANVPVPDGSCGRQMPLPARSWMRAGIFGILLVLGTAGPGSTDEPLPAQETLPIVPPPLLERLPASGDETGFLRLFEGDVADGWAQCGPGGFTLKAGVAASYGGMGLWWYTNRTFANFVLRGEWKMESPESDTGVFVRFSAPGADPWNAVRTGHELEIGEDPDGRDPVWRTGALYPFSAPARVGTRPVGEWNSYEFAVIGHTYIVRINGATANVWVDPERRSSSGYIGLQNYEDGKGASHRNVRIKELE